MNFFKVLYRLCCFLVLLFSLSVSARMEGSKNAIITNGVLIDNKPVKSDSLVGGGILLISKGTIITNAQLITIKDSDKAIEVKSISKNRVVVNKQNYFKKTLPKKANHNSFAKAKLKEQVLFCYKNQGCSDSIATFKKHAGFAIITSNIISKKAFAYKSNSCFVFDLFRAKEKIFGVLRFLKSINNQEITHITRPPPVV